MHLSINLAGIKLKNPTILASGIMGVSASSLKFCEENGAGAVTLKSIGPQERVGHKNPTVILWEHGVQNAVGLSNPGIVGSMDKISEALKILRIPLIGSMFADKIDNFKKIAEQLAQTDISALEVNLSCPNTEDDFGRMFALDTKMTYDLISVVKKTVGKLPVFAKLSGENPSISEVGKAAESAGADGITAINTMTGLIIDIQQKRPILTNKVGGISGPAIRPIGVRAVWNLYQAVKIPIIGTGGVNTGEDAIQYIMAGATAVGIGSGVWYRGIDVFRKVTDEIGEFMKKNEFKNLEEMRGIAQKK